MARNIIEKIQDIFNYDKVKYKEFVKRYGFTLPKFLFRANYCSILTRDIDNDNEDNILFKRLSRFKDFTEDEILYFLENVERNNAILNSSNYKFWCNSKIVNTFINDYNSYNGSYIDKACELNIVDIYIKFKDVVDINYFVNNIQSCGLEDSLEMLNKISITGDIGALLREYKTFNKLSKPIVPYPILACLSFLLPKTFLLSLI